MSRLELEVETDAQLLAAARRVVLQASEGKAQVLTPAQARQLRGYLWDVLTQLGQQRARAERLKGRENAAAKRELQLVAQAVSEEERARAADERAADAETRAIIARTHLRTIVEAFTEKADGHRGNYARAIMAARVWLGETSTEGT